MSRDNKMQMPSSGAGITRYFEDYKSKFQLKPTQVFILAAILIAVIMFLHLQG